VNLPGLRSPVHEEFANLKMIIALVENAMIDLSKMMMFHSYVN
jgi:hypothetical protein